jgi:tripartite ATP-independent transporter DctM subunit
MMAGEAEAAHEGVPGESGRSPVMAVAMTLQRIAMAALMVATVAVIVDVVGRATIGFTVRGIYEISNLVMAMIVAGAVAPAFLLRRNVDMDLLSRGMSPPVLGVFAAVAGVAYLALLSWQLLGKGGEALEFEETTSLLGVSVAPFWYVTGSLLAIATLSLLITTVRDLPGLRTHDARAAAKNRRTVLSVAVITLIGAGITYLSTRSGVSSGWQICASFLVLYLFIAAKVPIAVSLGLVGFAYLALAVGLPQATAVVQNQASQALGSNDLAAIPLFLLMGNFSVQAGLSSDIFRAASRVVGSLRGGLVMASVVGCGAFGAICGSSVATTATFGKVAYDEMSHRGYAASLSTGALAAGGTLGALIPPSVVLIIYCVVVEASIQKAFMASLVPGLLAIVLYLVAVKIQVTLKPSLIPAPERFDFKLALSGIVGAWRPSLLFAMVLGGLYGGLFTTQEAAAVGAFLSFLFAVTSRGFTFAKLKACLDDTAVNTTVIYMIVVGANIFAGFLTQSDIAGNVLGLVDLATTPHWLILLVIVVMYLIMGCVFDTVAAVLVTAPFVIPLIQGMGYDLVWWGVVTLSLVEIGMITPPIGMNVFVMNSVIGHAVPLRTIFAGIVPFLMADMVRLTLLILLPIITLWLPKALS